jgi:hypothetical protein
MSSKVDKAKLAAGAKEIRKAQAEANQAKAATVGPITIPESTRPIEDIVRERVTILPGSVGLRLADNTPIEESLRVLDWTIALSDHAGFMIGDVINFGHAKWGREKYDRAVARTGRKRNTLQHYASVAARIPIQQRQAALSFEHHRVILRIGDVPKIATVLREVGKQAEKGLAPTVKDLRIKVQKLTPRKAKRATSGKGKRRKARPEPPPYEPPPHEQAKIDDAEDKAKELGEALKSGDVFKIVALCDNKEKQRWLDIFKPFVDFYNNLNWITGY